MYQCELSNVAKEYLSRFYCILDNMIKGMKEAELTESISGNFIAQMIPHHRAAIEMSENLLKYTTCIPLQKIAQQIIMEQTKSIEDMLTVESVCLKLQNDSCDVERYESKVDDIIDTMFCAMNNAPDTNQINANFMREMIPHHEGAIEMSRNALQYCICPQLVSILEAIIMSQEQGVAQMKQLLCSIGYYR